MKQRTIDLLEFANMPLSNPTQWQQKQDTLERLINQYSRNAVISKLNDLTDKGYIEYGVSVRGCWLTQKGKEVLQNHANRDDGIPPSLGRNSPR